MKTAIHEYFRMGTLQWMSYPALSADAAVKTVCAHPFFDYVEVGGFQNQTEKQNTAQLLQKSGMKAGYGLAPLFLRQGYNPNALEETERERAEQVAKTAVDDAKTYGFDRIVLIAGPWRQEDREQAFEQLVRTVEHVCGYAADRQVGVELEIFDYDFDKSLLIGPAPLAARLAGRIRERYDNFGLLVDLSHIPLTREKTDFVVETLRPYLTHFHIGNAIIQPGVEGYGDTHPPFGVYGGANDIPELADFFRALQTHGFFDRKTRPVISFEIKPRAWERPEQVVEDAIRAVECAWAQV